MRGVLSEENVAADRNVRRSLSSLESCILQSPAAILLAMETPKHAPFPGPPHNPGVRDLVQGKRAWDTGENREAERAGFRGWHERGFLPHRDSPGLTQFVTYHLADAFPSELLSEWGALLKIEEEEERREQLQAYLDKGRGKCWLKQPELAWVCEKAFRHFQNQRYELKAWCVLPNHVHALFKITTHPMAEVLKNWKGYTAWECNKALGGTGASFGQKTIGIHICGAKSTSGRR